MKNVKTTSEALGKGRDFSLVLGGPLYQLYRRTRLLRPPIGLLVRRMIAIPLLAWGPLFLISLFTGKAQEGVDVPFLYDLDAHVRLLAALPLLIGAESVVHRLLKPIVIQFIDRGIIAPEDRPRFEAMIDSIMRLRNSVLIELLLLVFAVFAGYWIWRDNLTLNVSTWYAVKAGTETHLTPAGYWYAWISLPMCRFILFRWYVRLSLWYRFLWQVRKLPLRLNLFHPDRVGGLGMLNGSAFAFAPVLLAHTVLVAGLIGNRIWHVGAKLPQFKLEIVGAIILLLLVLIIPLCFFIVHLLQAKETAAREYGTLASRYVDEFREKWTLHGLPQTEPLLGSSDFQSLADLANGYAVSEMRLIPLTNQTLLYLTGILALPLLPLTLTMLSLEELIDRIMKVVI